MEILAKQSLGQTRMTKDWLKIGMFASEKATDTKIDKILRELGDRLPSARAVTGSRTLSILLLKSPFQARQAILSTESATSPRPRARGLRPNLIIDPLVVLLAVHKGLVGRCWSEAQNQRPHSPTHRFDEFPASYSLAGCSPAETASASPSDEELTPATSI